MLDVDLAEQAARGAATHENPEIREDAATLLASLPDDRGVELVESLLEDPDENVRERAEDALAELRGTL